MPNRISMAEKYKLRSIHNATSYRSAVEVKCAEFLQETGKPK
ncbi:hypothetical protein SAMN05216605_119108 [Pseudomonas abietaniphila]|uniref:Uncharacterized protein n=1 Tax=Pseudomonas abietaniphila TaxID=89065 RepID=A0A1G8PVJ6_9PSED|nr:hypothetical protein SAMN05216605_119108 [Pseudomonas abietaniphila]